MASGFEDQVDSPHVLVIDQNSDYDSIVTPNVWHIQNKEHEHPEICMVIFV